MMGHTFDDLMGMVQQVTAAFDRVEERPWTIEVTMIELMKQVGDLAKRIMMVERYYLPDRASDPAYQASTADIGNELADILYCIGSRTTTILTSKRRILMPGDERCDTLGKNRTSDEACRREGFLARARQSRTLRRAVWRAP